MILLLPLAAAALVLSGCRERTSRFPVSLVELEPYFSVDQSDSVTAERVSAGGRSFWNLRAGPWRVQVFAYRVGGIASERDFSEYAEAKSRLFLDEAREWLAEFERTQGGLFPEPEVIRAGYTSASYREDLTLLSVRIPPQTLTQALVVRLYDFADEAISLEMVARGFVDRDFDVGLTRDLIALNRRPREPGSADRPTDR